MDLEALNSIYLRPSTSSPKEPHGDPKAQNSPKALKYESLEPQGDRALPGRGTILPENHPELESEVRTTANHPEPAIPSSPA